ncbi:MAG: universal stress protein, partial [Nitrospira sp.]
SAASPVTDFAARYLSETRLAELKRPAMERATTLVNALRDEFINEGYPVVTQIQMNHVTDTIVKSIEANHDQLLVIGSRELTKSERLHLGSVSESLLRHAPCSLLIVRGGSARILLSQYQPALVSAGLTRRFAHFLPSSSGSPPASPLRRTP